MTFEQFHTISLYLGAGVYVLAQVAAILVCITAIVALINYIPNKVLRAYKSWYWVSAFAMWKLKNWDGAKERLERAIREDHEKYGTKIIYTKREKDEKHRDEKHREEV